MRIRTERLILVLIQNEAQRFFNTNIGNWVFIGMIGLVVLSLTIAVVVTTNVAKCSGSLLWSISCVGSIAVGYIAAVIILAIAALVWLARTLVLLDEDDFPTLSARISHFFLETTPGGWTVIGSFWLIALGITLAFISQAVTAYTESPSLVPFIMWGLLAIFSAVLTILYSIVALWVYWMEHNKKNGPSQNNSLHSV